MKRNYFTAILGALSDARGSIGLNVAPVMSTSERVDRILASMQDHVAAATGVSFPSDFTASQRDAYMLAMDWNIALEKATKDNDQK